jgi:hypothetical protein
MFLANLLPVKFGKSRMRRKAVSAPVAGPDCRQRPHLPERRATTGIGHAQRIHIS